MRLRDPLADRESETEAAALGQPRTRSIGPPKTLKDVRKVGRRDADARVADGELHFPVAALERDLHRTAARRVFDRVRDEVQEQLPQSNAVTEDGRILDGGETDDETGVLAEDDGGLEHLVHEWLERERLAVQI